MSFNFMAAVTICSDFGAPKNKVCHCFVFAILGSSNKKDGGSSGGSVVKNPLPRQETRVQSLGQEDLLEKEMATHSSILAWEIPQRSLAGGLQFMRSQKESDMT